jgi:deoxyhypusine monooxygenase
VPREGEPAVHALCAAFDEGNPLLKHEVAFVLGQLEHPAAVEALCAAVRCEEEHGMVRHEAAEALGAIGSPDAISVLREFSEHPEPILRESCWVALHMYDREAFLASGVCV